MASAVFNQNYVRVDADPTVASLNLGFTEGADLLNTKSKDAPISGKSTVVLVKYSAGGQTRAFQIRKPIVFSPMSAIKFTGGAENSNEIKATDSHGNEAIWEIA